MNDESFVAQEGTSAKSNQFEKKRKRKFSSLIELEGGDGEFGSYLSPGVKELLVKFKKSRVENPFSRDNQSIIDEFILVSKRIEKSTLEGDLTKVNLTEAALLLECSMKTFSKQVLDTRKDIYKLAEHATSSVKHKAENETMTFEKESPRMEPEVRNELKGPENMLEFLNPQTQITSDDVPSVDTSRLNECQEGLIEEPTMPENQIPNSTTEQETSMVPKETKVFDIITIFDDVQEEEMPEPILVVASSPPVITDEVTLPNNIGTSKSEIALKVNADVQLDLNTIPSKRTKKDYGSPPHLTSCFEEEYEDDNGVVDDTPPELSVEIQRTRKRATNSCYSEELHNAQYIRMKRLSGVNTKNGILENVDLSTLKGISEPLKKDDLPHVSSSTSALPQSGFQLLDSVVIKVEKKDEGYEKTASPVTAELPDFLHANSPKGFGNFTPADEDEIESFINQLHYLPFTCELSKEELAKTFEYTIERLESIYKEHNVSIHRHVVEAASDACAYISSSYAKWLEMDQVVIPDSSEVHELFSQRIRQQHAQNSEDSELTIMETTHERTKLQSDYRMREMLNEVQRLIVPKYTKIPLIEENTEGFFRRVKAFENRMKKILAEEESRDAFDIRKYEMDVLDVANMQSHEMGLLTSPTCLTSPMNLIPDASSSSSSNESTPILNIRFDGLPSPSSSYDSGDGIRWISLRQIFAHMKNLQRREAARTFCAVMALLSFENLDVKYENHFSEKSAALIDKSKNLNQVLDGKHPRGVKIMTSRCPNADTEEIYIAALTSKSRTEVFREVESKHQEQEKSDQASPNVLQNRILKHSAILEFYEELHVEITSQNHIVPVSCGSLKGLLRTIKSPKRRAVSTVTSFKGSSSVNPNAKDDR